MSRITLAFSCFFGLLFGGKLPKRAADFLPEDALPKALPAQADGPARAAAKTAAETPTTAEPPEPPKPKPGVAKADIASHQRDGALGVIALLQREGRFVDFMRESLDDFEDADIGAAVRDVHRGCNRVIEAHLALEPVMPGEEDDAVTVPVGFDPAEIRLVGEVSGDPPFKGTLRHAGLRAIKAKFPELTAGVDRTIIAPAEVEVEGVSQS